MRLSWMIVVVSLILCVSGCSVKTSLHITGDGIASPVFVAKRIDINTKVSFEKGK